MSDKLLIDAGFGEEVRRKNLGLCTFCKNSVKLEDFGNDKSRKEFSISGLCQECQNKILKD